MKYNLLIKTLIIVTALAIAGVLTSCEQENYEPAVSAAPGGGTVSIYKAYTLGAANPDEENIYGRIVFYKYSSTVTLVQIGLYNTDPEEEYASDIFNGALLDNSTEVSRALDKVSGESGAFATYKYYTIKDAAFYDALDDYDANVKVRLGESIVAAGDIGLNAAPVEESE